MKNIDFLPRNAVITTSFFRQIFSMSVLISWYKYHDITAPIEKRLMKIGLVAGLAISYKATVGYRTVILPGSPDKLLNSEQVELIRIALIAGIDGDTLHDFQK